MFETLFSRKGVLARHRNAPLRIEREQYMTYLLERGSTRQHTYRIASMLLNVIQYLLFDKPRMVTVVEIEMANKRWVHDNEARKKRGIYSESSQDFKKAATSWLRFLDLLISPLALTSPYGDTMNEFAAHLRDEKGLQPVTISSCNYCVSMFLRWSVVPRPTLASITARDLDQYILEMRQKGFKETTIATSCQRLRTFFRYTEARGITSLPLSASITSPVIPRFDSSPKGPRWKDVRKMLAVDTVNCPASLRARAIMCLCAIYGLRGGEVISLCLGDFDWHEQTFTVRRFKNHRVQRFPIQPEVGEAIVAYLRHARATCHVQNLFISFKPPYRPLTQSGLGSIISKRMRVLCIQAPQHSSHALRHSCATQLLHRGVSLKDIADFLGHSDTNSVCVYAKCAPSSIRLVANFGLENVL